MNVYVFGNSLFFVVVINGLCKVVEKVELDVEDFIYKNFYVDMVWFFVEFLKKLLSY